MKRTNAISRMSIYSWLIVLILCSNLFSQERHANRSTFDEQLNKKEYKAFFKYFEMRDTLYFNYKNLIIGDITNFIYMGKSCVLFDRISDSLFYIDLINEKYRSITTEDSLPGYHLNIMQMVKINENDFVISSDPYNYILFSEG